MTWCQQLTVVGTVAFSTGSPGYLGLFRFSLAKWSLAFFRVAKKYECASCIMYYMQLSADFWFEGRPMSLILQFFTSAKRYVLRYYLSILGCLCIQIQLTRETKKHIPCSHNVLSHLLLCLSCILKTTQTKFLSLH